MMRVAPSPAEVREAVSIDVSGPEFEDFSPSESEIAERLRSSGLFRPHAISRIAKIGADGIRSGVGYRKVRDSIVRSGDRLSREEVKALGFHGSTLVGRTFVESLATNDPASAPDRLQTIIHVASSRASQLHNLRRYREAGVTEVSLSSPGDERATSLEKQMDGRPMTIDQAIDLVRSHDEEIWRSVFRAKVVIEGETF